MGRRRLLGAIGPEARLVMITEAGTAKLAEARPARERAQARMQALLPEGTWRGLQATLPEVARLTAGG